jgi:hypothetical protein
MVVRNRPRLVILANGHEKMLRGPKPTDEADNEHRQTKKDHCHYSRQRDRQQYKPQRI